MDIDNSILTGEVNYCKAKTIAKLFSLSVRRIQQLTQDGILSTVETSSGNRYDLAQTVQTYVEYLSNKAHGKSGSEAESELKRQKLEQEIKLKKLLSEYREIQNAIASGEYIDVKQVEEDYRQFFTVVKKFLLGIPAKLSARLTSVCDDPTELRTVESELNRDMIALLNNFVAAGCSETVGEVEPVGKAKANAKNKKIRGA